MSKNKRVSAYTKNRNRILRQIRRTAKSTGVEIENIRKMLPTERDLRSKGITGHKLTSATNALKKMTLEDVKAFVLEKGTMIERMGSVDITNEPDFVEPFMPYPDLDLVESASVATFHDFINKIADREGGKLLLKWKALITEEFGAKAFAQMIEEAIAQRPLKYEFYLYKAQVALDYIDFAMNYLPEGGIITQDRYSTTMQELWAEMHTLDTSTWEEIQ